MVWVVVVIIIDGCRRPFAGRCDLEGAGQFSEGPCIVNAGQATGATKQVEAGQQSELD